MAVVNMLPHKSGFKETLLWTNPDRTANFAAKDVTLSETIDTFKVLKIVYAYNQTSAEDTFRTVIIPVWNLNGTDYMYKYAGSAAGYRAACIIETSGGTSRARTFNIKNGTTIHFYGAQNIGGSTTANTTVIPVYIYGIK